MRNTRFIVAAFAALTAAFAACTSTELDVVVPDGTLTKKTFEAIMGDAPGSKTTLNANGKTIEWKAGDFIAVYDDVDPTTPHKFKALSNGTTSSFEGEVNTGSTKFYAVYPYDACVTFDSVNERFTVQIPQVQYAVKDGYDPRANVAAAYVEGTVDDKLYFKLVNGLLKFTVDYDDIVGVQISNDNRYMSGYYTFDVQSADSGKIANVGNTYLDDAYKSYIYKNIMLKNEDGSPLEQGATYYIVSRQSSVGTPYNNPTVTLISSSAKAATKSSANGLVVARKSVVNLGTFSGLSFVTSRYAAYQAGFDIEIGGKVYNKSVYGDAQLMTMSDNTNIRGYLNNDGDKVTFLADGDYTCGSVTVTNNIAICPDGNGPVTVNCANGWNVKAGSLAVYGLEMTVSTSNNVTSNAGSPTSDVDYIVFDHCKIINIGKPIWQPNSSSKDYIVNEFTLVNCTFGVAAAGINLININSCNYKQNCHSFTFKNNLVYATPGTTLKTNLLNSSNTATECTVLDIDLQNNIFVNVPSGNMLTYYRPKSLTVRNNIQWETNTTDQATFGASKAKLFKFDSGVSLSTTTATLADNYAYGMDSDVTWTYSDGNGTTLMTDLGISDSGLPDATPLFTVAPVVTAGVCSYTLAPGYTGIGPQ